jgi:hypothetical protein
MGKSVEYSKLKAVTNGVLVCTKKEGAVERFDYVPLEDVIIGGEKLSDVLNRTQKQIKASDDKNEVLEKRIAKLAALLGITNDYLLAQAAEGAANEKDSIY